MKYKIGDVVLVKMTVKQIEDNKSTYLLTAGEGFNAFQMTFEKYDIIALISRKSKKDNPVICAGGAFLDHPEEAKGAFQPAKWSKLDMGELYNLNEKETKADGWQYGTHPDNPRDVRLLFKDGHICWGWYQAGEWWQLGNNSLGRITVTSRVSAWKELFQ